MKPRLRGRRTRRWAARAVFYPIVVFVAIPMAFCHVLTRVPAMPVGRVAAGWQESWTPTAPRLRLWHRGAHGSRPTVVIVHGLGDSLESYLDLGARYVREGYGAVLLDLRAHGGSAGRTTTMGGLEREDVRAALDWIAQRGSAGQGAVLAGHSAGAVACLRAAVGRSDVRALVVEAPFDTYRNTVVHHARLYYRLPEWFPLTPIAIRFAAWHARFDPDDVDALAAARQLHVPLLAIVDGGDPRMPEAVVRKVYDAHPGPKELWVAPEAPHVGAVLARDYWPTVLSFLARHGL